MTKHGLTSDFAKTHDESTLAVGQRSRLAELRQDLQTPAGVRAALIERAARLTLIAEWGEEWLREKAEKDGAVAAFTAPMLARFFTASAECRRSLSELAKLPSQDDGADGVSAMQAK